MPKIRMDLKNVQDMPLLKVHLVFESMSQELVAEISRYCVITCVHNCIEEMCNWIKDNKGASPDLFLINCARYFTENKKFGLGQNKLLFFNRLHEIKKHEPKSRLVLLIPEFMANDLKLLSTFIKLRIFDLWFVDSFDKSDILGFLSVIRTQEDLEKYIREKEAVLSQNKNSLFVKNKLEKIYRPYYVKSNVIAFWTLDEPLLNHAAAVLTAFKLATNGFKVALIEGISPIPRLAHSLHIEHPYFNMRHALSMFSLKNTDFIRNCLFNTEKYQEDTRFIEREELITQYPREMFFLPDRCPGDNSIPADISKSWREFITSLTRITIFEQNFNFLIFICEGLSEYNDLIINELAYTKFLSINLHPGSIVFARKESIKENGNLQIIGYQDMERNTCKFEANIDKPVLYPPSVIKKDFLKFIYNQNFREISDHTQVFIDSLTEQLGVKITKYIPAKEKSIFQRIINFQPGR